MICGGEKTWTPKRKKCPPPRGLGGAKVRNHLLNVFTVEARNLQLIVHQFTQKPSSPSFIRWHWQRLTLSLCKEKVTSLLWTVHARMDTRFHIMLHQPRLRGRPYRTSVKVGGGGSQHNVDIWLTQGVWENKFQYLEMCSFYVIILH